MASRASLVVLVLIVVGVLVSCGGGSGGVPPERPSGNMTGIAFDGHIVNGTVTVYDFAAGSAGPQIATTATDAGGFFGLDINAKAGPLLIEVTDGSYAEEASGVLVNLAAGQRLQTLINYAPGSDNHISLTYLTHVAAGLAQHKIEQGQDVASSIDQANALLSAFASLDVVNTEPQDVTEARSSSAVLTDELRYGFYAAGVSQWTREVNEQQNLAAHALYNSIQFAQLAQDDIIHDGVLDGIGTRGQLTLGAVALSQEVYTQELALAMARFAQSTSNTTGFGASSVLSAYSPALESSSLFGETEIIFAGSDKPKITDVTPADGALVAGTVTVRASVFDVVGVSQTIVEVDGNVLAQFGPQQAVEYLLDTALLSDGAHVLLVRATNGLDLSSEVSVSFTVRNINFAFGSLSPPTGALVSKSFTMKVPMADPGGVVSAALALPNGDVLAFDDPANAEVVVDSAVLSDGKHAFTITAKIADGREEVLAVEYTVDNTAPELVITGFESGDVVQGTVRGSAVASDANGVGSVELWLAGEKRRTWTDTIKVSESIDTTKLPEGELKVRFVAYDRAGNSAAQNFTLIVDNEGPSITVSRPTDGAVVSGTSVLEGKVTDKVGVSNAKVSLGRGEAQVLDGLPDFSFSWDSSAYKDGPLAIEVTATDTAGHQTSRSVSVVVDNNPPVVQLQSPAAGDVFNKNFVMKAIASDASGIKSVVFRLGDQTYSAADASKAEAAVDVAAIDDNVYPVSVEVKDGSGASASTDPIDIMIDKTMPELGISPEFVYAPDTESCVLTVSANDNLSGLESVQLDGTDYGARSGTWTHSVDMNGNQKRTVSFTARDLAGNEASMSQCVSRQKVVLGIYFCLECP